MCLNTVTHRCKVLHISGFGVAGISGIMLIITGLTLSLVDNVVFNFDKDSLTVLFKAFFLVTISTFVSLITSIWLASKLLKVPWLQMQFV